MAADEIQSVLWLGRECMVFRLPPRANVNVGVKAADWESNLIWRGRIRILETTTEGSEDEETAGRCEIRLEDAETGELFANAPYAVDGKAIEAVLDSSRYFVLAVVDPASGQRAFLGLGFIERSDAFDFQVALQEWTRRAKAKAAGKAASSSKVSPHLPGKPVDFSLKENERISISIGGRGAAGTKPRPQPSATGGLPGLLPPPPSARDVRAQR